MLQIVYVDSVVDNQCWWIIYVKVKKIFLKIFSFLETSWFSSVDKFCVKIVFPMETVKLKVALDKWKMTLSCVCMYC